MPTEPSLALPAHLNNAWKHHLDRTLRLAFPVMLNRAGILVLVVVDSAMTGHASTTELAYLAIAMAPQVTMMLVGIGLLMGTIVLSARADGARRYGECGAIWRLALIHAALYGVLLMGSCQAGEWFLNAIDQPPDLALGGAKVLVMLGWGIPAVLMFTVTTLFLEGINRPLPGMVIMLLANLLNAALNWLFIYGHWGLPAMGAEGAALATTLVRWFVFLGIATYVLLQVDQRYNVLGPLVGARQLGKQLRRIGYPMGLSTGLESSAFSFMTLLAGLLGPIQVAAFQIGMSLVALVFMCALGFSTAASVRVANAIGRGNARGLSRAGWSAVALVSVMLGLFSMIFFIFPDSLSAVYTREAEVLPVAIAAIAMAALVLVPDGIQAVLMGALRGMANVWPTTLLYLFSFWVVMVPLGYLLGVVWNGGAAALMQAISVACVIASLLLTLRFRLVAKRAVASPQQHRATRK